MGESQTEAASVQTDIIRVLFSTLDRPAYLFLGIVYELFFNVASADLFANDTIMKFYGRVQLIIGVFMMFQLAMTILKGIMNPDSFTDSKSGANNLIVRIATALILLTVLVPISIPSPKNEYEKQINNNGLLFGTLYSLQHRILSNNTLGRLILGTNDDSTNYVSFDSDDDGENLKTSSRIFTSTVLKGFYRINLLPEEERPKHEAGKDDSVFNDNRVCKDISDDILDTYTKIDADPQQIISLVTVTCTGDGEDLGIFQRAINLFSPKLAGNSRYVLAYHVLFPFITAIVFVFILLSFTIDVAVRAVKLAVLRLIAPIPIISYMDPKGSKDNAFNSWVKVLSSTYLDLFIRLAAVYFVIFMIQDMIVNGIVIKSGSGIIGIFSLIIIWIGLFIFAKQAPKFIKQVLGMKDEGGKLFGGFGEIGAAIGMAAAIPGAIGSGIASAKASKYADVTRQGFGETDIFGRPVDPESTLNKGKHLLAGITGAFAGGAAGMKAAYTAKDHGFNASMEAMQKRNAKALEIGNNGSTLFGRLGSSGRSLFLGEGSSGKGQREIDTKNAQKSALEKVKSRMSSEMVKKDWTYGAAADGFTGIDSSGSTVSMDGIKFNYKDFLSQMNAAQASGSSTIKVTDSLGHSYTIDYADADKMKGKILTNNEDDYIQNAIKNSVTLDNGTVVTENVYDKELVDLIYDATAKGAPVTNRDSVTKNGPEKLDQEIRALERSNTINKANDRFAGGKK